MLSLWMTLLCSVDSGEALFEKAMSLESTQSQVAFIEAAESFVHDAATNADPNVAVNAGLAWARAGHRPKAKQMILYAVARLATTDAWRALQLVRVEDGLDAIQGPRPWFAPLARLGVVISTLLPAPAVVAVPEVFSARRVATSGRRRMGRESSAAHGGGGRPGGG